MNPTPQLLIPPRNMENPQPRFGADAVAGNEAGGVDPVAHRRLHAYLAVLRTPGFPIWQLVVIGQRIPVAMAPLAFVYLGRSATGSFVAGTLLAGVHAISEAICAAWMGRRFDRRPVRAEVRLVLGAEALILAGLAVSVPHLPVAILVIAAALVGGVAAGAHGGLRALLVRTVPAEVRVTALSLESTTSTLVWTVSPAIVAGLVVLGGDEWPTTVMALAAGLGAIAAAWLPAGPGNPAPERAVGPLFASIWPSCVQTAAAMLAVGSVSIVLPSLLTDLGTDPDLAGVLLSVNAAASVAAGLLYGARARIRTPHLEASILLLLLCLAAGLSAIAPGWLVIGVVLFLAGAFEAPGLIARSAALQNGIDESQWSAGHSAAYAAAGVGYGAAGIFAAPLLSGPGPQLTIVVGVTLAALLIAWSGAAETLAIKKTRQGNVSRGDPDD